MGTERRVVLVTGANRGIGLEISRQLAGLGLAVIMGGRDKGKLEHAAGVLRGEGGEVEPCRIDITDPESIGEAVGFARRKFGRLDVLVNNAGAIFDPPATVGEAAASLFNADLGVLRSSMETNLFGAFMLIQQAVPLMKEGGYGRIVNLSTGMAQLSDMGGGWPGYRLSKTALNALTRVTAAEVKGSNILVNCVCPGWVRTEMGGEQATRSPEEGAETPVWLATLPDGGPSGAFFRDKKEIPW